jgi:hypothetical protein
MPTRPRRKKTSKDVNEIAARIVAISTGQPVPKNVSSGSKYDEKQLRSQAASILGKLGGSKGGKERAKRLTPERRSDIARKAAQSRWRTDTPQ